MTTSVTKKVLSDFCSGSFEHESGTCLCGARNYGPARGGSTGWLYNFDAFECSYSEITCSKCGRVYSAKSGELLRDVVEYVPPHLQKRPVKPSSEELEAAKATVLSAGFSVVQLPKEVPPGSYTAEEAGWDGPDFRRDFVYAIRVHGHLSAGNRCFESGAPSRHSHG